MRFAVSKSPDSTAFRIAVLLTIVPFEVTGSTPTTLKSSCAPSSFRSARLPARFFPKDHSCPTQISRSGLAALDQLPNEISRRGRSQLAVKLQHQQMRHAEGPDERDLVLRRGEKTRAFLRTEKLCRVRVESNDDRCPARFLRVARRGRNNRLMAEMDPVENPNRKKNRPGNLRQLRD